MHVVARIRTAEERLPAVRVVTLVVPRISDIRHIFIGVLHEVDLHDRAIICFRLELVRKPLDDDRRTVAASVGRRVEWY